MNPREWYDGLAARERRAVRLGAGLAAMIVIAGLLWPLHSAVTAARARVSIKQQDLAFMRAAAPQILAAGPALLAAQNKESLVVIVDRLARESGLTQSLAASEPAGANDLRVRLENATFDGIVAWLARLVQQHGVAVLSANVEAVAGSPGIVNAQLVLRAQ